MTYNYSFGRTILSVFQFGSWLLLAVGVILLLSSLGSVDEKLIAAVVVIISSLSGILSCIIGSAIIGTAETNQDISETNKQILKHLSEGQVSKVSSNSGSPSPNTDLNSPIFHEEYLAHSVYKVRGMYTVGTEEFTTLLAAKSHIEALFAGGDKKEKATGKVPYYLRGEE